MLDIVACSFYQKIKNADLRVLFAVSGIPFTFP